MALDLGMLGGLELLSAVIETGSFGRAGERIGLTQSGVSRAVARLEERVGVRLFDRNSRAVVLTDEGKRFHEGIAPLLERLGDAIDQASHSAERVRGRLRVNADTFFARYVLAPRLDAFLARYPELELEILSRPHDHVGGLVAEGFDVAVRFGEPTAAGLIARKLLDTRILTCASPEYLARRSRPRHPRDLTGSHECILFVDPQTGRPFDWDFHRGKQRIRRVPVRGRLVVNDVATALGACLAGYGVAQLMELGNTEHLRTGALVELFPRWHDERFPLYAFHPSRHLPPAKVRAFLDFVVESTRVVR
ncbi:MAG TPA: LysR family transcriptional regulator [Polyangiaceae bacterium]|jgi:DNA-binding transcriptional LysR family regulator